MMQVDTALAISSRNLVSQINTQKMKRNVEIM